jgi:hypothetical protein
MSLEIKRLAIQNPDQVAFARVGPKYLISAIVLTEESARGLRRARKMEEFMRNIGMNVPVDPHPDVVTGSCEVAVYRADESTPLDTPCNAGYVDPVTGDVEELEYNHLPEGSTREDVLAKFEEVVAKYAASDDVAADETEAPIEENLGANLAEASLNG